MLGSRPLLDPALAALLPTRARTFAFAARFLPRERRTAAVVLYAFCRVMDDLVDEPPPGVDAAESRRRLRAWADWLRHGDAASADLHLSSPGLPSAQPHVSPLQPALPQDPEPDVLAGALRSLIAEHQMPTEYLLGLLSGLESDLDPVQMPDYTALRRYCFLVAGTVGLAMSHLLGARQPAALTAAAELGIAMQLTNILRDIGDDLRAGRCYLPADELAVFGFSARRLMERVAPGRDGVASGRDGVARSQDGVAGSDGALHRDEAFRSLMRFQIARVRRQYDRGLAGIPLLPPEARPAILVAGRLYRGILDAIEANEYDVISRRAATSRATKLYEACATLVSLSLPVRQSSRVALAPQPERLAELTAWLR